MSFNPAGSLEDFFNFDLLNGNGSAHNASSAGASSRSSSHSPSTAHSNLPPTPSLDQVMDDSDALFNNEYYNFGLLPDVPKSPPTATLNPSAIANFDFLDSFGASGSPFLDGPLYTFNNNEGSSSSSSVDPQTSPETNNAVSPEMTFSIDPALMKTSSKSSEDNQDESDEDDEDISPLPVKVGGKGKGRKGTVASGGIRKASSGGGPVLTQAVRRDNEAKEDDDWRPSPEEYKKMSSKEKRQLRNKISARNFRVRRKEYITTLEGDIADRDNLIDAIRNELGSTKLENQALRHEVDALKKALLKGNITPDLPPPGPLSPNAPAAATLAGKSSSTASASNKKEQNMRKALLPKANTLKDLPTSPRLQATGGFWGGANTGGFGARGATPVHTTLVPELAPLLSEKLAAAKKPPSPPLQENMNPFLNGTPFYGIGASTPAGAQQQRQQQTFDSFTDLNPFTLKTLDSYRMQLWGQVALRRTQPQPQQQPSSPQQFAAPQPQQPSQVQQQIPQNIWTAGATLDGLAGRMQPQYFATPKTNAGLGLGLGSGSSLVGLLSGKSSSSSDSKLFLRSPSSSPSSLPSPPSSNSSPSPSSSSSSSPSPMPTPQQATIATLASQTLLKKMSSAFWEAFSTPASSNWDTDKVRRVLEGKAVLRVVDVSAPSSPTSPTAKKDVVDGLEESMKSLTIGREGGVSASAAVAVGGDKEVVRMKSEPCFFKGLRGAQSGAALAGKK
ncbi:hypothetical protein SISSUDRAFT_1059289 [Sistotremastrum suecicum HHB10207 ss-3]|uniref:BZIP domain-containing protein n=1 Tax=Sistotremastrum suecicum HHB10207 ss-3 TaxID=1314776 RepID=A0A166GD53_9AGAM|nr:hypothetical protein SISSUDRAFT_1059289 [Sistotremastrum suecicum HHB10207 ss-3]